MFICYLGFPSRGAQLVIIVAGNLSTQDQFFSSDIFQNTNKNKSSDSLTVC